MPLFDIVNPYVPLSRDSYAVILGRQIATIESRLTGADARLPASDLNVQAHVVTEVASGLYDFGIKISKQIIPSLDMDEAELAAYAADWGIRQNLATPAAGSVTVTRSGSGDIPVKAGVILQCSGLTYSVTEDVTVSTATAEIPVLAVEAGAAGNLEAGLTVTFISAVAGLAIRAASAGISGGTDKESKAALLSRLQERMQRPAHGGNPDDFKMWSKAVSGVTRAWPYRATPRRGFTTVLVVKDGNSGGPIPSADEIQAVQDYIDRDDIGPICGETIVRYPDPVTMDYQIQLSPNTAEVQAAVWAAMRAWFRAEAAPGFLEARSRLSAAISAAAGEEAHKILTPVEDPVLTAFQMAVLGDVTFQDYEA